MPIQVPDFWKRQTGAGGIFAALLAPIGRLYGAAVRARARTARPYRPKARVICVGNISVGGTGKTPLAMEIARTLADQGLKPVLLTRGYGGRLAGPLAVDLATHRAEETGDEPLLLAAVAPTVIARRRDKGAAFADAMGADVIIMDDGHQNFSLTKDLSIVVVDAQAGFGNGRMVPAGPLREPPAQGLARADAVVLMGDGEVDLPGFAGEVLRARLAPIDPTKFAGRTAAAFAGIGRPEKFFRMLTEMGVKLKWTHAFSDHHPFSADEVAALKVNAAAEGALLLTTEKDFVRLAPADRPGVTPVLVRVMFGDPDAFAALVGRVRRGAARAA